MNRLSKQVYLTPVTIVLLNIHLNVLNPSSDNTSDLLIELGSSPVLDDILNQYKLPARTRKKIKLLVTSVLSNKKRVNILDSRLSTYTLLNDKVVAKICTKYLSTQQQQLLNGLVNRET